MRRFAAIYIIALALAFAQSAFAQARTTPVRVTNTPSVSVSNSPTVKIDTTVNTVKAQQNGTWNVGVMGTPSVSVTNTPDINIANTPSVTVGNSPTVKMDATDNTVRTLSRSRMVVPWASDQTILAYGRATTGLIDAAGYKEIRAVFQALDRDYLTDAKVCYWIEREPGVEVKIGNFQFFHAGDTSITDQAGFAPASRTTTTTGTRCMFTVPVMGDKVRLDVTNDSPDVLRVSQESFVYLVD